MLTIFAGVMDSLASVLDYAGDLFTGLIEFLAAIVIAIINTLGYFGVFLAMAIESACIPLPSEIIMPFSGSLASEGRFNIWLVGMIGALGNLAGSLLAYWVGAREGRHLIEKYGKYVLISHHDLDMADRWFARHGNSTVFFTRMMPIVRTFISFPAGVSRMRLDTFCIYTFLGSLPWSLGLAWIGMELGDNWETMGEYFHKADLFIAALLIIGIVWYVRRHLGHLKKDRTKKNESAGDQPEL